MFRTRARDWRPTAVTATLEAPAPTEPATETPATPKTTSPARVAANRRNSLLSTGPRTEEGKARSRQNAVKHGMAGLGIALPTEDAALVQARFLGFQEELAPTGLVAMTMVEAMALASVRMRRAARQETAALTHRVSHAAAEFDEARRAEADKHLMRLTMTPATSRRRLLSTPEGIDLLIARLHQIRAEVRNPNVRWNFVHERNLEACFGRETDEVGASRSLALSHALMHETDLLTPAEIHEVALEPRGYPTTWAMPRMEALIDAEVAELRARRDRLDHVAIARDRDEAADAALFDPSPDAILARRYEAAAQRMFFRCFHVLNTLKKNEAGANTQPDTIDIDSAPHPATEPPSAAATEALAHGDQVEIPDPADDPPPPPPSPRPRELPPLASSGITAEQASRELSYFHADIGLIPIDEPLPPIQAPPLVKRRGF